MAVYELRLVIEVPEDFRVDDDNEINDWVDRYILNAEGLCKNDALGCSLEHWASGNVLSDEEYEARFED
jgi:hypothetical protein